MGTINTGDVSAPEKPKGYIRGIWAILIIVVVAMLVGGGVWWWYYSTTVQDQTTTNTAKISPSASPSASTSVSPSASASISWKTYTNNTYKYSFEYPADTKPTSGSGTNNPVYELENGGIVQFSYGERSNFDIRSMKNYTNVANIEQYLSNMSPTQVNEYDKITIAGETGYKFTKEQSPYIDNTYFMHSGRIYQIIGYFGGGEDYECGGAINNTPCGTPSPKEETTQVVYDKILSSFKFL